MGVGHQSQSRMPRAQDLGSDFGPTPRAVQFGPADRNWVVAKPDRQPKMAIGLRRRILRKVSSPDGADEQVKSGARSTVEHPAGRALGAATVLRDCRRNEAESVGSVDIRLGGVALDVSTKGRGSAPIIIENTEVRAGCATGECWPWALQRSEMQPYCVRMRPARRDWRLGSCQIQERGTGS